MGSFGFFFLLYGVLSLFFFLIFWSTDPINSVLLFILVILILALGISCWAPFWSGYLLILLFLSGILVVLLFISTMSKPLLTYNKGGLIFCFVGFFFFWFQEEPSYHPFWGFYTVYTFAYFFLIGLLLIFFLFSCYLLLTRKIALRYL